MKLSFVVAAACSFVLAISAPMSSAATVEHRDWSYGENGEKAIEFAKERNLPIVLLITSRESSCPKCVNGSMASMNARPHKNMIRVVYYRDKPEMNSDASKQLAQTAYNTIRGGSMSMTVYMTADGLVLGYVPYEETNELSDEGKTVLQIHEWIMSVPDTVEKADRQVDRGRYEDALQDLAEIPDQGAKVSHLIQQLIGKVKDDAEMPETPVITFFPDLYDEKFDEYKAHAEAKLAEVETLLNEDKVREAQREIRVLARTPEAFELAEKVEQVRQDIEDKLRNARG